MKTLGSLVLIVILLAPLGWTAAHADEAAAKRLVERGDRFWASRDKGRKWVDRALSCYEKALSVDTRNVEASWKFARTSCWIASKSIDRAEKVRVLERAIDINKRAITIDDRSVESHYQLGICFARYGEVKGAMKTLGLLKPLRKQMRRVIELDASHAGGGAYRILGWVSYKLPAVAGGSTEEALKLLEKARKEDPGHLLTHLCLAEIHRENDRPEKARTHLEFILKAKLHKERRPEEVEIKVAAKEMLAKLPAAK